MELHSWGDPNTYLIKETGDFDQNGVKDTVIVFKSDLPLSDEYRVIIYHDMQGSYEVCNRGLNYCQTIKDNQGLDIPDTTHYIQPTVNIDFNIDPETQKYWSMYHVDMSNAQQVFDAFMNS